MCFRIFIANFGEKMFAKPVYLLKTLVEALFAFKWAIWALFRGCTSSPKSILRATMCTIKTLWSGPRAATANSFFSISSTYLIVGSTFLVMWDIYCKSRAWKLTLTLLIVKKSILSTIFGFISVNRKQFQKTSLYHPCSTWKKWKLLSYRFSD